MGEISKTSGSFFQFLHAPFPQGVPVPYFQGISAQTGVLDTLRWGIEESKGILILTGQQGIGKTSVLLETQRRLCQGTRSVLLNHPPSDPEFLLENLLLGFGVAIQRRKPKTLTEKFELLQDFVLENALARTKTVILIDDAHLLSCSSLEFLRLLSNLMTEKRRLLTIALAGEPSLLNIIHRPEMRQFSQRVFVTLTIRPMTQVEADGYIKHYLTAAGGANEVRFEPKALFALHQLTSGNPEKIRNLAHRIMELADIKEMRFITKAVVAQAAQDLDEKTEVSLEA